MNSGQNTSAKALTTMINLAISFNKLPLIEKIYQVAVVLSLVMVSGFPLFLNNTTYCMLALMISIAGLIYYKPSIAWALGFIALVMVLHAIQTMIWGRTYLTTAIFRTLLFTNAALAISILGYRFMYIYNKIILFFSKIAVILFIPMLIHPKFYDLIVGLSPYHVVTELNTEYWETSSQNIFFLNFPPDFYEGLIRNSGPFWEPGAFGGFLMLALIFSTLTRGTLKSKENLFITLAIFTTFSTTTYFAFSVFCAGFILANLKTKGLKWIILSVMLALGTLAYLNVSFLGKKIDNEIADTETFAFERGGDSRLASVLMDYRDVTEDPRFVIFGRGSALETRVAGPDKELLRTCGLTDLVARFGIVFAIVALASITIFFRKFVKQAQLPTSISWTCLATILILSFSEVHFAYPMYYVLIMFGLYNPRFVRVPVLKTIHKNTDQNRYPELLKQLAG